MGVSISEFRGEYYFLSNFYSAPVTYNGMCFENNEAAFQAAKCPERMTEFCRLNPSEAKRLGRRVMSIAHKSSVFPLRLKRLLSTAKKTHWWSRRIAESVRTTKTSLQATSCSASITKNMCRSIRGGGFMTSTPMKGFLGLP